MTKYIAFLRGINVGGNHIIKMADLKDCFESMGFVDVSTYIQSGNVLFTAVDHNTEKLITSIEASLLKRFGYGIPVVVVPVKLLSEVIRAAPHGFGSEPTVYRYDVIFLKSPLVASEAMKSVKVKEGVDRAYAGKNVLYFSRLIEKASQSNLSRIIRLPVYQHMTIRNWNTTTKLFGLAEK